jgi:integrase
MAVYRPKYRDPRTGELVESHVWWYEFTFAGKRYRGSTKEDRKTLAGEFEKGERLKIERAYAGLSTEAPAQRIRTVSEALKAYRKGYETGHREKSLSWVKERAAHVERLLGGAILPDLTEERIRDYMGERLTEGAGNRTVNMEVDCLARAVGRMWRERWPNVKRLEENREAGRALSPEEEKRLLAIAAANRSPLILPFIRIALLTGMRSGEIRALGVGQLDWKARSLRVGRAKTRAGAGREIPMNSDLADTLAGQVAWLGERFEAEPQADWHLFPFSSRVRPVDPTRPATTIKTAWESVRKAAKVDCRFHDLRHTALTKMAEAGVPESTMLALAGHMSRAMLERYSHIRMAAKREAVESLALPKAVNANGVPKESPKVSRKSRLSVVSKIPVSD